MHGESEAAFWWSRTRRLLVREKRLPQRGSGTNPVDPEKLWPGVGYCNMVAFINGEAGHQKQGPCSSLIAPAMVIGSVW